MARKDFWLNVRRAVRLVLPNGVAESPLWDADEFERRLRDAVIWLTPQTVDGFNPADFEFLTPTERQDLAEAVQRFRDIARQKPSDEQAKDEQIERALPYFRRILEIVRPDKYGDAEALELGKKVELQLADQLPSTVRELRFETGVDWVGKPALFICIVFNDEPKSDEEFLANAEEVRPLVQETVHRMDIPHWPFVSFRIPSDLKPRRSKRKAKK